MKEPLFIVVDLFCGAGGTTTGFAMTDVAKVIACVNHDPIAIKSHWANHPEVAHFEEDIRTLPLSGLKHIVKHYRKLYPKAKLILWASLECTNFSKAKGGQPRDPDSRTLADHLDRYIFAINPDYIKIENVVEFMSWGPLDQHGKPVSRRAGSDWMIWRNRLCSYGYRDEWKELNSANYGAYTSRNRLFGCFAKPGLPIVWPEATHAKTAKSGTLYEAPLKPWKPVKDVLDFSDEGQSIFGRKKELSEKTLERIYAGLIKYVAGCKDKFILKYNSVSKTGEHHPPSVDDPCPTITCQNRLGVAFIQKHFSGKPEGKVVSVEGPTGAITTSANQSIVQACFLQKYYSGNPNDMISSIDNPASTIRTKDTHALVNPCFIASYYSGGGQINSIYNPSPCLVTKDRCAIVQPQYFIDKQYSGSGNNANHQSIEQPAGTILANDKHCLIEAEQFITRDFSGGGQHQSIDQPAGAILSVPKISKVHCVPSTKKHRYIVNPSHGGHSTSIDAPCPVIIARQDKAPLYFIEAETGNVVILIYEGDTPTMKKIKEFMALYGLIDIKMRMLKVRELLKIQGFPANYILRGNQSDQKKFIGNSVVPLVVKVWIEAMAESVIKLVHEKNSTTICQKIKYAG